MSAIELADAQLARVVIDADRVALQLASAGHEPPVWVQADGTRRLLEMPGAGPLGVDVADDYPVWRGQLMPGDTLLLYTDGVTEAFDAIASGLSVMLSGRCSILARDGLAIPTTFRYS